MSPFKVLMAAVAFGAVASSADMAFAGGPDHGGGGCKTNCNTPPPATPQGDNIRNDATATANGYGWGYGEANATGGNATGGTAYGGNATGGQGGFGQGGNSDLTNNINIRNRAAANGGFINMSPEGCNQVRSAWIGTLPANIGGGYSKWDRECGAQIAAESTMRVGAQTGDQATVAVGIQGLAALHPEIQAGVTTVGGVLATNPCAVDAPSAIMLLNQAAAARVACRPPVAPVEAGLGQQQSIIVNIDDRRRVTTTQPRTCPSVTAEHAAANRAYTEAVGRDGPRSNDNMRLRVNALADEMHTLCGPLPPK